MSKRSFREKCVFSFKRFSDFEGRSCRSEYWLFELFNAIVFIALVLILNESLYTVFSVIYSIFIVIPLLSVKIRRLHDIGKSGWYIFIPMIPIIGGIWFFLLLVTEGDASNNKYGMNPNYIDISQ